MKKLKLFISLCFTMFSVAVFAQAEFEKIAITQNTQDNLAGRLLVQDVTTGEIRYILKSVLDNKFNQPTGNATQYLDGAGNPTTFPVLGQSDRVITEVRNTTGATVTKGTVVYLTGASGGKPTIQKAQANAESTSSGTFGVIQSDINNNSNGYVVVIGTVLGLNTSSYSEGQILWLSPTTAGGFTTTKPVAPNHAVYVAIVTLASTQGTIEVKIQNGYEIDELHDVLIVSKTDNDGLIYDAASGLWKNKQITKSMVGLGNVDNTSDVNKPISTATQNALNLKENTANKNIANGYAGLGSDGKLFSNQLPSITITDTFVVGSQAAMLALTAETGDVAVRTDVNKSYILKGTNPAVLADWQELLTPTSAVTSVFGRNGAVTAQNGDYTTALVTETTNKRYQTDAQALYNDATSSIQTQLNAKENLSNKSTSTALGNSDTLYPTQNAVKVYVDGKIGGGDFANVVYVDSTDPNTATIFDLNNPPVTNDNSLKNDIGNLYIGTNNSTWTYKTSPAGYYTYTVSSTSSNFYLTGTTVDAGSNKISEIQRAGAIKASAFKVINGSGSQFLKGNGALDTNTYTPTSRTITINGVTQDLSASRSWTINGLPSMLEYNDTDKTIWNNGKADVAVNTSFGDYALRNNVSGSNDTAFGYGVLNLNTTGSYNTGLGTLALGANTTGSYNTAIGQEALYYNNTGYQNVAIGKSASSGNTSGYQNLSLGESAGRLIADGTAESSNANNSVFLGYDSRPSILGQTNEIVIGASSRGNGSNSVTLGNTDITKTILRGNVGIGTETPQAKLQVVGVVNISASSAAVPTPANGLSFYTGLQVGVISCTNTAGANTDLYIGAGRTNFNGLGTGLVYSNGGFLTSTNPSDERLKDKITDLNYGLNEILQLRPVTYNWKSDTAKQGKQFGFIAQEVQQVMPELVKEFKTEEGNRLGLDKEGIYAALVKAIQEQQAQIKELQKEIEILKNK